MAGGGPPALDALLASCNVAGDVDKLAEGEVVRLWSWLWPSTDKDFCAQYGLHNGSVSRTQSAAAEAILEAPCPGCGTRVVLEKHARFDCHGCTRFNSWYIKANRDAATAQLVNIKGAGEVVRLEPVVREQPHQQETSAVRAAMVRFLVSELHVRQRRASGAGSPSGNTYTNFGDGWSAVAAQVLRRGAGLATVVLLDADQAAEEVRRLAWLLPADEARVDFHVVAVAGGRTPVPPFWPHRAAWCSWLSAPTAKKQAADLALTTLAALIHQREPERRLHFVVVSRDLFAETLAETLSALGRACAPVDHHALELGLHLLAHAALTGSTAPLSPAAAAVRNLLHARYVQRRPCDDAALAAALTAALEGAPALAYARVTVPKIRRLDEQVAAARVSPTTSHSPVAPVPPRAVAPDATEPSLAVSSVAQRTPPSEEGEGEDDAAPPFSRTMSLPSDRLQPPSTPPPRSGSLRLSSGSPVVSPTSLTSPASPTSPLSVNSAPTTPSAPVTAPMQPAPHDTAPMQPASHVVVMSSVSLRPSAPPFVPRVPPEVAADGEALAQQHPVLQDIKKRLPELGEVTLSVLGQRWPWSDELAREFKCDKWLQVVQRPAVQDYLCADLLALPHGVHLLHHRNFARRDPPRADPAQLTPDELRDVYRGRWAGTQRAFCQQYACNEGNFSSFLNRRRAADPASCAAIRRWLAENPPE